MLGGARCAARGVTYAYVAVPRERANAADGPFQRLLGDGMPVRLPKVTRLKDVAIARASPPPPCPASLKRTGAHERRGARSGLKGPRRSIPSHWLAKSCGSAHQHHRSHPSRTSKTPSSPRWSRGSETGGVGRTGTHPVQPPTRPPARGSWCATLVERRIDGLSSVRWRDRTRTYAAPGARLASSA